MLCVAGKVFGYIEVFNIDMVAAALNDCPDLGIYSRPCHRFQLSPRRSFAGLFVDFRTRQ